MSETKRTAATPRGGRRKGRSKAVAPSEAPPEVADSSSGASEIVAETHDDVELSPAVPRSSDSSAELNPEDSGDRRTLSDEEHSRERRDESRERDHDREH